MIKNERQYRITKAQADKFRRALDGLGKRTSPGHRSTLYYKGPRKTR